MRWHCWDLQPPPTPLSWELPYDRNVSFRMPKQVDTRLIVIWPKMWSLGSSWYISINQHKPNIYIYTYIRIYIYIYNIYICTYVYIYICILKMCRLIEMYRKLPNDHLLRPDRDQSCIDLFWHAKWYIPIIAVQIMIFLFKNYGFSAADGHGILGLVLRPLPAIFNLHFSYPTFSISFSYS